MGPARVGAMGVEEPTLSRVEGAGKIERPTVSRGRQTVDNVSRPGIHEVLREYVIVVPDGIVCRSRAEEF